MDPLGGPLFCLPQPISFSPMTDECSLDNVLKVTAGNTDGRSANIYLYPLGAGGSKRLVFSGQLLQEGYLKTPISGFTQSWKMLFPEYWGY